jgi:alkylation response protein AidB-like acyl-CoA dehydrogenase
MDDDVSYSQPGPHLGNQYLEDSALRAYLKTLTGGLPEEYESDLLRFGKRVVVEMLPHHLRLNSNLPKFEAFDAWGKRIDSIETDPSWSFMHLVAAQERLLSIGYSQLPMRRLYQFTKLYLYAPSSGMYLCPLAMTDGAATLTRSLLLERKSDKGLEEVFSHLTSSDPQQLWTAGQWMTEKRGGSDVAGGTRTVAQRVNGDLYKLYGVKWFTSAIQSDVAYTLAKIDGAISLFLVKVRKEDGGLNGIQVLRLKDKLGTKQVPTAELLLTGCEARLCSKPGQGIKRITELVNVTRLYNSVSAVSHMRRIIALARDYAHRRQVAGGVVLAEVPLHLRTLGDMELRFRGCLGLLLFVVTLLDKVEEGIATPAERQSLRLLTPITKLYTAKEALAVVSEGLESFGGLGYMENSGLPGLERDVQVLSIWEGTTNVLSLDTLRALSRVKEAPLSSFKTVMLSMLNQCQPPTRDFLTSEIDRLSQFLSSSSPADLELFSRQISFTLAHLTIATFLALHSQRETEDREVYEAWVQRTLPWKFGGCGKELSRRLALDLDKTQLPRGYADVDAQGSPRPRF